MKRLILLMLFPVLAFAQTTKPPVATGSQDNVARDSIVTHRRNIDSLFLKVGVDNATRDSITVHRSNLNLKLDKADTASLSARINLKQAAGTYLVPSDTSSLTARFAAKQAAGTYLVPSDTSSLTARFAAKQAAGTYLIPSDTSSLTARFNAKQAAGTYLIPSDTSSLTARFAAKQAAGTYLVPSDTSSLTARFSNTKVADSLTSGTLPIARMPNSGVGAGAYTYPYSVTVDQYGRVTAAVTGNKPAFGDTLLTKWADSTGLASASRAAMVWNSTLNKWQVQQAVKIGTDSLGVPFMARGDSLGTLRMPVNAALFGLSPTADSAANTLSLEYACANARANRAAVYIPRGTYKINRRIILDWDGAGLVGDGIGQTVLKRSAQFNILGTYSGFSTTGQVAGIVYVTRASNVTISGITVDANYSVSTSGTGTGNGIVIDSTFNATVTNCQVKNITGHTYGIWVRRSKRFTVTNNIVSGDRANTYAPSGSENMNELIEVSQGNTEDGIVSGNVLTNSSNSGVLVYDFGGYVRNVVVSGNTISKCGIGVAVDKLDSVDLSNGITVSGNMLDSCTIGIRSTAESFPIPQKNVSIRGNTIRRSTEGINAIHNIGLEITDNIIDTVYAGGSSLAAIWCYNDTSVVIRGNTIRYVPGKYGVSLNSTNRHVVVSENLIDGAGRTGIYLSSDYAHVFGNYVLNANVSGETDANVGSGIALESVDSALVQSNTVIDTRVPRLMVSNIYLNSNTSLSVTNNRLNGNSSGYAIKTDNTNTGRVSLNDGHLNGAFVNGSDYATPDSMVTTDGVNARGLRVRNLSNQRIPLIGPDGSIISRTDLQYDNSIPLYAYQKSDIANGLVQAIFVDTVAAAAGVGGGIGFRGKKNAAGDVADYGFIKGAKANAVDGDLSGELRFYTRRAVGGYVITERFRIDSTGNLLPAATGTYDLGSPALEVDSLFVQNIKATSSMIVTAIDNNGTYDARSNHRLLNKAAGGWLTWGTRNTAATEAVLDLDYIGKLSTRTNTGATIIDSMKVVADTLGFYIGGVKYKAVK